MTLPAQDIICVLLETPFSRWKDSDKSDLLRLKLPEPVLTYHEVLTQKSGKQFSRNFKQSWYSEYPWLCGSFYLNKLFCWPCLLLSVKKSPWNTSGFQDFRNATRAFHKHKDSTEHLKSEVGFKLLKQNLHTIADALKENARMNKKIYNDNVTLNRKFMKLPVDVTLYLAKQELAFRGHDEKDSSQNRGNFKELLKGFIDNAALDVQNHYFKKIKISHVFSGDSKTTQNELIGCISDYVKDHIKNEVKETSFFALQVDDTTDIAQRSQCTIILRFVNSQSVIVEHFMGFFDLSADHTAQALFDLIKSVLEEFDFTDKLIAQCYDGASVMSGHLNGLQAKVKEVAPQAVFVHCLAHRLNLILQQSFNRISKCRRLFATISGLPAFFHHSSKRTAVLESMTGRKIPTATQTRWFSNAKVIDTIVTNWEALKNTFLHIMDSSSFDHTSIRESEGFLNKFNNFEFTFLSLVFHEIFGLTEILFDVLQKKSLDISYCIEFINHTCKTIESKRNDEHFENIFEAATKRTPLDERKRQLGPALEAADASQNYRVLYFEIIDNVITEFKTRFKDMEKLKFISIADTSKFEGYSKDFPTQKINSAKEFYPNIFKNETRLKNELQIIYNDPQYRNISLQEVIDLFIKNDVKSVFTEAYMLFCLILTIPSTSASAERSFSCLKRIKTYLRNSTSQERLTQLSNIAIEKSVLNHLIATQPFYDDIIDKYAALKNRRIDLVYKK